MKLDHHGHPIFILPTPSRTPTAHLLICIMPSFSLQIIHLVEFEQGCEVIQWGMNDLLVFTPQKKSDLPISPWQLSIFISSSTRGEVSRAPPHSVMEFLTGLTLGLLQVNTSALRPCVEHYAMSRCRHFTALLRILCGGPKL